MFLNGIDVVSVEMIVPIPKDSIAYFDKYYRPPLSSEFEIFKKMIHAESADSKWRIGFLFTEEHTACVDVIFGCK